MAENAEKRTGQQVESVSNIRWDDSNMRSQYSNVCDVTGTREEITLLFGVHRAWRPDPTQKDLTVQLQDRVILNPFAAKRLHQLMGRVLQAYGTKYGTIQADSRLQAGPLEVLSTA